MLKDSDKLLKSIMYDNLFENTEQAFAYKTDSELALARTVYRLINIPTFAKLATRLTPLLMKADSWIVSYLVEKTIYKMFVGGATLEEIDKMSWRLSNKGVQLILDYAVEGGKEKGTDFDQVEQQFRKVVKHAINNKDIPFVSIKVSALAPLSLLEKLNKAPRLRSGIHDNEIQKSDWKVLLDRVFRICIEAVKDNVKVLFDAEESWLQDPIDRLAMEMMHDFNGKEPMIFNTIQLYRQDRLDFLKLSHTISKEKKFKLGVKLVRGAYMEKERERAAKLGYPSPIQPNKVATDLAFDKAVDYCLDHIYEIGLMVASHNEPSSLRVANLLKDKGLFQDPKAHVYFSQLYGMSDHISFNLAKEGYSVSKYMPFGPLEESVPYLMRRAQENSSIEGQSNRELALVEKEIARRTAAGTWIPKGKKNKS